MNSRSNLCFPKRQKSVHHLAGSDWLQLLVISPSRVFLRLFLSLRLFELFPNLGDLHIHTSDSCDSSTPTYLKWWKDVALHEDRK